jgi:hypothetical protein
MTMLQMLQKNGVDETRTRDLLRDSSFGRPVHTGLRLYAVT